MVKKDNILDCKKCKHLYVTYDKFYPWGCKAFGFKSKKYPYWRIDTIIDKKKYFDLGFIESGGWHFTNIMSPEKIDFKMRNFLHHLEYEESGINIQKLKELILNTIKKS